MASADEHPSAGGKPWTKPTMRLLVAGWFGDSTTDGIVRAAYEFSPNYPPSCAGCDYQNPPS